MTGGAGGGPLTGLHAASPSATSVAARHAVETRNGLRRAAGPRFTASSPRVSGTVRRGRSWVNDRIPMPSVPVLSTAGSVLAVVDFDADVCVLGAGYAGLTAARRITQAGATAIVLEARDRVGGRVWTRPAPDGTPVDVGGTWLGPGQDRAYALAAELGVTTYPTWNEGETVFAGRDTVKRFGGLIPPTNPIALASLTLGMARLDA